MIHTGTACWQVGRILLASRRAIAALLPLPRARFMNVVSCVRLASAEVPSRRFLVESQAFAAARAAVLVLISFESSLERFLSSSGEQDVHSR